MAIFRNDFGEDRVVPHIGYQLVPAGSTVTAPDEEALHWVAGGWARVDEIPAAAPAKTSKAAAVAATEGGES